MASPFTVLFPPLHLLFFSSSSPLLLTQDDTRAVAGNRAALEHKLEVLSGEMDSMKDHQSQLRSDYNAEIELRRKYYDEGG